jgi:Family of unknown function (DUF6544)
MRALAPPPAPTDRSRLGDLPGPVRRYADKAMHGRHTAVATARLRHRGSFRPRLDGAWLPIRGVQYFVTDPPSFVWWGRVRIGPGLWIDARDRCVAGVGGMCVSAESTVTLADVSGPMVDQSALLRLLGELAWLPTALMDDRYVGWTAVDVTQARAALRVGGRFVAGTFEFGPDDLPLAFRAERNRDLGGGRSVLTPFSAALGDYRDVGGLLVPHDVTAIWHIDGRSCPYARFLVESLEYDT